MIVFVLPISKNDSCVYVFCIRIGVFDMRVGVFICVVAAFVGALDSFIFVFDLLMYISLTLPKLLHVYSAGPRILEHANIIVTFV